jgi:hypothetical protein
MVRSLLLSHGMLCNLLILPIVCLIAATGCDEKSPAGPSVPLNQEFTLAPAQAATIRGTSTRIEFVEVTGDSRCPADAVCIQGGDAIVHIRTLDSGKTNAYQLHTGDASLASVTHGNMRIELVQLQPYPFSARTIAPGDYRATLKVSAP